jgi:hypothetical protein
MYVWMDGCNYILAGFKLVYELAAGGADVPKHVGVLKDNSNVFVVCASDRFYNYFEQKCSLF